MKQETTSSALSRAKAVLFNKAADIYQLENNMELPHNVKEAMHEFSEACMTLRTALYISSNQLVDADIDKIIDCVLDQDVE